MGLKMLETWQTCIYRTTNLHMAEDFVQPRVFKNGITICDEHSYIPVLYVLKDESSVIKNVLQTTVFLRIGDYILRVEPGY